jgi:hypothetical protein
MEINGLPIIFVLPAAVVALLAISMGMFRFFTAGAKRALVSVVRVIVYGGFVSFVLVMSLLVYYYSTGGH